jgi:rhomboid family protein
MAWSAVPAQIVSGHHWITILTAMFMHGSWSHITGNMVFLWAFGPEIEDVMGRSRYLIFYLLGGLIAMLAQVAAVRIHPSPTWVPVGRSQQLWAHSS